MKTSCKTLVLSIALTMSTSVFANNIIVGNGIGVELELPLSYKGTEKASMFAVTNHLNVNSANKIFKHNGLTTDIWADKVTYVDYDSNKSARDVRNEHNNFVHSGTDYFANKAMVVVRLAEDKTSSIFGAASAPNSDIDINPQLGTERLYPLVDTIGLNIKTVYGGEKSTNAYHTFAHELGHSLGAEHENKKFNDLDVAPYNGATSVSLCADGTIPLMIANATEWDKGFLPWISGTANCPVLGDDERMTGNAPVMQQYYNSTQAVPFTDANQLKYNPSARTPSTFVVTVTENINNHQFDFALKRTQTNATTGTLFIAGNGIGLTPVNFNFANAEIEKTISVDFTKIHNLLEKSGQNLVDGKDYIDTVYAIAQTDNEVVKGLTDVSAVNTQYTFVPKDKEPQPEPQPEPDNGGGGGGSSSFAFLAMLLGLAWLRKR
ncbi:hypothetical protein C0W54_12865 [Photobacterium kishitanii]|uniref:M12 family metallo-peptidase n=1 Tax=Photobacterium kishitanii TaxID=318456 RepID=UPI000D45F24C|nr:M12 family metallo-peptidase [Photobacterium kishitanii]PSW61162.1 hypothetical protein C0W54_12865 [Photobacterium kishitanii]